MPTQQPSTPILQLGDPIARGLVWAWTGNNRETISGVKATLAANGSWRTNRAGRAIGRGLWNSGTSGTGATWPYTSNTRKIGTQFTLMFWGDITSTSGGSSKTLLIPANGTWTGTFVALGLNYTDGNTFEIRWTSSGATQQSQATSPTDFAAGQFDGVLTQFCGTRNGANTVHYVNGKLMKTSSGFDAAAVQFNTDQGVSLGGNPYVTSEYAQGYYPMAFMWNRVLSASEVAALWVDPWRLWRQSYLDVPSLNALAPVDTTVAYTMRFFPNPTRQALTRRDMR